MAKKKIRPKKARPSRGCLIGNCPRAPKPGAKVCPDHLHPLRLQEEIERLRATREGGWEDLLHRFPELRRIGESIAALAFRADPLHGGSLIAVAGKRGHRADDGIVDVGDHKVLPGYAVDASRDSGRLGAAAAKLRRLAGELEGMLDPDSGSSVDTRIRCGSRKCSGANRRQSADTLFCRFCGRALTDRDPQKVAAANQPRSKPSKPADPKPAKPKPDEEEPTGQAASVGATAAALPPNPIASNGSRRSSTRIVSVTAESVDQACLEGLSMVKSVFSGLDVAGVVGAELAADGAWRVTVRVYETAETALRATDTVAR